MQMNPSERNGPSDRVNEEEPTAFTSWAPKRAQPWPPEIGRFLEQKKRESEEYIAEEDDRKKWLLSHSFRPSADVCVDGRVSDLSEALGLPIGILQPYRSAGATGSSLESYSYAIRVRDFNRKLRAFDIGNTSGAMAEMRFSTVHYSASRPDHSCAAWANQTERATFAMQEHVSSLNATFAGSIVAFVMLIDTDLDALTLLAPKGKVRTAEIADMNLVGNDLFTAIRGHLLDVFPQDWSTLVRLPEKHQQAFHGELASMLAANVAFVRDVKSTGRPVELLEHQERLIFIGRPGETKEHNTTFLIGDFETEALKKDFGIALGIVAKNLLADAIAARNENWRIPVVISVPFDEDEQELTVRYARGIRRMLERDVPSLSGIGLKLLSSFKFHSGDFPEWVIDHCSQLRERISWCVTVNDRRTRTFYPLD